MRQLSSSDVAIAFNALSECEQTRVQTLVAYGVPRSDAVSVVWSQHEARTAKRPATRRRVISRAKIRQTASDRTDANGMPIIVAVRHEGTHRAYAVQGVYA